MVSRSEGGNKDSEDRYLSVHKHDGMLYFRHGYLGEGKKHQDLTWMGPVRSLQGAHLTVAGRTFMRGQGQGFVDPEISGGQEEPPFKVPLIRTGWFLSFVCT